MVLTENKAGIPPISIFKLFILMPVPSAPSGVTEEPHFDGRQNRDFGVVNAAGAIVSFYWGFILSTSP
jgi:hypothetical protein